MATAARSAPDSLRSIGREVQHVGPKTEDGDAKQLALLAALFDRTLNAGRELTITGDQPEVRFRRAGTLVVPLLKRAMVKAAVDVASSDLDIPGLAARLPARRNQTHRTAATVRGARVGPDRQDESLLTLELVVGDAYLVNEASLARDALQAAAGGAALPTKRLSINFVEFQDIQPDLRLQQDLRGIVNEALPRTTAIWLGPVAACAVAGPEHQAQYVTVPFAAN